MILIVLIMILLLINRLSRHCAGIVCTERRRKHGTICTDTKKPGKDQTRNNRARMAIKAGDPGKSPGNIPADIRGVQVRPEWIARHKKENYTLGRLSPAFFPCAGASAPVRSWAARLRKCLFAVLRRFLCQMVRSTAQAAKTSCRAKYKRKRHKKIIVH